MLARQLLSGKGPRMVAYMLVYIGWTASLLRHDAHLMEDKHYVALVCVDDDARLNATIKGS